MGEGGWENEVIVMRGEKRWEKKPTFEMYTFPKRWEKEWNHNVQSVPVHTDPEHGVKIKCWEPTRPDTSWTETGHDSENGLAVKLFISSALTVSDEQIQLPKYTHTGLKKKKPKRKKTLPADKSLFRLLLTHTNHVKPHTFN